MSRVFRTFKVLKKNMFLQCVLLEGVPNCSDLELPVLLTETTFCAPWSDEKTVALFWVPKLFLLQYIDYRDSQGAMLFPFLLFIISVGTVEGGSCRTRDDQALLQFAQGHRNLWMVGFQARRGWVPRSPKNTSGFPVILFAPRLFEPIHGISGRTFWKRSDNISLRSWEWFLDSFLGSFSSRKWLCDYFPRVFSGTSHGGSGCLGKQTCLWTVLMIFCTLSILQPKNDCGVWISSGDFSESFWN